jgi:CHAD domain-containing protein
MALDQENPTVYTVDSHKTKKMAERMDPAIQAYGAEIMLRQLTAMRNLVPGVIKSADIENIHQLRVASRRLRAAQLLFDEFLPRRRVPDWESLIKRITRSLGQARDLDIQIETIQRFRLMVMDPRCQPGAGRLYLRLLQDRSRVQKRVIKVVEKFLDSPVIQYIQPKLQIAIDKQTAAAEPAPALFILANEAIRERLDVLLSYEEFADQPDKLLELHAMRIAAKKLRYTLEIFAPIYPGGFKQWLKPLREVQDLLGLMHDCDVWAGFLPDFVDDERKLTLAYFGNQHGFSRILPGIEVFQLNRAADRKRHYLEFYEIWGTTRKKRLWEKLPGLLESYLPAIPVEPAAEIQPGLPDENEDDVVETTISEP